MKNMKRIIALLLAVITLLLCGCQPTPTDEPVPNKGDNVMEAVIKKTPVPTEVAPESTDEPFIVPHLDVPDRWEEELDIGGTRVVVDADIIYEDVAHPVYIIKTMTQFDGKAVKALMDNFMDAKKWRPADSTREELLTMLENVMKGVPQVDPVTGETIYVPYEGQQEDIDAILALLAEASPEENWEDIKSREDIPEGAGFISDGKRKAYYYQEGVHFYIGEDRDMGVCNELLVAQGYRSGELPFSKIPEPSMTRERAEELTNELLEEIGMGGKLSIAYVCKAARMRR